MNSWVKPLFARLNPPKGDDEKAARWRMKTQQPAQVARNAESGGLSENGAAISGDTVAGRVGVSSGKSINNRRQADASMRLASLKCLPMGLALIRWFRRAEPPANAATGAKYDDDVDFSLPLPLEQRITGHWAVPITRMMLACGSAGGVYCVFR